MPICLSSTQHQNSSLTAEYAHLNDDCPELPWASRVFGGQPDATNLWIGDERSVTSFHKGDWRPYMGFVLERGRSVSIWVCPGHQVHSG